MSGRSTAVNEIVKVLAGRESPSQAVLTLMVMAVVDTILSRGITMDLIYIPDGFTLWMVLIVAVFSMLGPVLNALFLKNRSKAHKYEEWAGKYTVTMIADMILTPIIGVALMSWIIQELPQPVSPETYIFIILPIGLLLTSRYVLIGLNEGIKAAAEQFNKDKAQAQDAIDTVKKN